MKFFLLLLLLVAKIETIGQTDTSKYESFTSAMFNLSTSKNQSHLTLQTRYAFDNEEINRIANIGLGYSLIRYSRSGHDKGYLRMVKSLSLEKSFLVSNLWAMNASFSYEHFITIGVNFLSHTDLEHYSFNVMPEIGIRYYNTILHYGYQIPIIKNSHLEFTRTVRHNLSLRYTIPISKPIE